MKLTTLILIIVVFATFTNALKTDQFREGLVADNANPMSENLMNFLQQVGGDQLMSGSTCSKQILASIFGLFALANLIWHGDSINLIVTKLFRLVGDIHSALVECGIL